MFSSIGGPIHGSVASHSSWLESFFTQRPAADSRRYNSVGITNSNLNAMSRNWLSAESASTSAILFISDTCWRCLDGVSGRDCLLVGYLQDLRLRPVPS